MAGRKVIALDQVQTTKDKLIEAVGRVLARDGFGSIDAASVAAEAGFDKRILIRHFGCLSNLVAAFGQSPEFWPSSQELLQGQAEDLKQMPAGQVVATFFKRYVAALRQRPQTLEILSWEMRERNELAGQLDDIRVRTALEFFEHIETDIPESPDLTAVVALMAGAVTYFLLRSRTSRFFGGFDFSDEADWQRLEKGIDDLLKESLCGATAK